MGKEDLKVSDRLQRKGLNLENTHTFKKQACCMENRMLCAGWKINSGLQEK